MQKIFIGSDHGGFELKEKIKKKLKEKGIHVIDLGTENNESVDYPDFAERVARKVAEEKQEKAKGILICGTGIGMSIIANKVKGIRAALIYDEYTARMAKEHNNANIICLGGRTQNEENAWKIINIWFNSEFEGKRHQRRIDKIKKIEERFGKQ